MNNTTTLLSECKGKWAIITGASSGLGRAISLRLSSFGVNLVLIARDIEPLQELSKHIKRASPVQIEALSMNLSDASAPVHIKNKLNALGIRPRILINNAGFGVWNQFESEPLSRYEEMIQAHVTAAVSLCHLFFGDLSSHPSSLVVNITSDSASIPVPFMAVYAATKAFLHNFSLALYEEWRRFGIRVCTFAPGPINTGFNNKIGLEPKRFQQFKWRSAEETADILIKELEEGTFKKGSPVVMVDKWLLYQVKLPFLLFPRLVLRVMGRLFETSKKTGTLEEKNG